jgi:hypothetical protein
MASPLDPVVRDTRGGGVVAEAGRSELELEIQIRTSERQRVEEATSGGGQRPLRQRATSPVAGDLSSGGRRAVRPGEGAVGERRR